MKHAMFGYGLFGALLLACTGGAGNLDLSPMSLERPPSDRDSPEDSSDSAPSEGSSSAPSQGTSPTSGGAIDAGSTSPSSLGPKCTSYLECCKQIAQSQPEIAKSCAVNGGSGASASEFEASCESALDALKQAGLCK